MKILTKIGPGFLVTAAFIGPGTITTASKTGAQFGFTLLWALLFSVAATMILQEMSARLGLISGQGLGEAIRTTFKRPVIRVPVIGLVVSAIVLGNAAFQTGNIVGAAGGLQVLTGISQQVWAIAVGAVAFLLLGLGVYKVLERVLMLMVVLMSVVFIVTAFMVQPDLKQFAAGIVPRIPDESVLTVVALIGTTVVPYNLFLHASAVREKWSDSESPDTTLKAARRDSAISISVGGLVTLAVMATAAGAFFQTGNMFSSVGDMADQLVPLFGTSAKYFFGIGLLAAGLTSAITAPLAAAYATAGVFGWERNLTDIKLRMVWSLVVVAGTVLAAMATKPVAAIVFAQAANGLLLPFVAIFLLVVMNRRDLLGQHVNGIVSNILGGIIVLVAAFLGGIQVLKACGVV